jgi:hypothetical protein
MKTYFFAVVLPLLLCLAAPMPVAAQSTDSVILNMTGTIEEFCRFRSVDSISATGVENFQSTPVGADVEVASLNFGLDIENTSDPNRADIGAISDGEITIVLDMYCNGPFVFSLAGISGALANSDDVTNTSDFTNSLTYDARVAFPDGTTVLTGTSTGAPGIIVENLNVPPQDGTGTIEFSFQNPSGRNLISGLYQEIVFISIIQDGGIPGAIF